jgi:hypothetical protein
MGSGGHTTCWLPHSLKHNCSRSAHTHPQQNSQCQFRLFGLSQLHGLSKEQLAAQTQAPHTKNTAAAAIAALQGKHSLPWDCPPADTAPPGGC